jgi:UDP:flavonoid glycosyltransferase YjiC (YdhE family)
LVLGLFPDWFAPPPSEWPPHFVPVGFSFYDGPGFQELNQELQAFLRDGDPPVVVSQASNMKHAKDIFATSIKAIASLGRRALLLTPHREQIPEPLPPGCRHFDYVPFGTVLPRSAAHIHHAGMGTIAQALRAGTPQLAVPRAFDQPDNARRLQKLGVAAVLSRRRFGPHVVASRLRRLIESPQVKAQCALQAARCQNMDGLAAASDHLERVFDVSMAKRREPVPPTRESSETGTPESGSGSL